MIMPVSIPLVLAVTLAGLAVAGLVRSPGERLHRIGADLPVTSRLQLPAVLRPRRDAPSVKVRMFAGAAALITLPLLLQSVVPSLGAGAWLMGPVAAGGVMLLLGRAESPAARRRRERMVIDLPHLLELMAAAMEAGLPLRNATRKVLAVISGPLADDLDQLMTSIDLGRSDADAWRSLRTHPVLDRVALDLARSVESGTMIVASLRHHAVVARRSRRGALEARARTVGVKSVPPLVSCFVPAFLLIGVVPTGAALFQSFLS